MSSVPEYLKGLDVIVEERLRQVEQLGYSVQHDAAEHDVAELMRVGACYIDFATNQIEGAEQDNPHPFWPIDSSIPWKPEALGAMNAAKGAAFVAAALDLMYAQIIGEV